jgi:hypothetical protein
MSSNILDPHDPNAIQDYAINWGVLLTADGESAISGSTWSSSVPPGLTVSSTTATTTITTAWVTGGKSGTTYSLTNRITTPGGRRHDRTIYIPCKQL